MYEITILTVSIISGITTYIVSHILKRGPVIASAIVTLIAGIMLPYFFPLIGVTLASVAACSSYAGMISVENALNLREMSIISLITGILYIATINAYVGIGGKLGTIAAIACFAWLGFKKVFTGMDDLFND